MSSMDLSMLIPDAQDLSGKAVLVTGGSSGIGRATARVLASVGARVVTFARDQEKLQETLDEIRSTGGEAHGIVADVSRIEDVRRVFEEVDRRLGGLDILVNNAAISGEDFPDESLEENDRMVRTNVVGYLACAHEALGRIRERGRGHVVLVGSMSADLREEGGSTYVATKGAIQAFAESLRKTVNEKGIRVTLIEPGKVATDMLDKPDAEMERSIAELKMLRPEDIAGCILYTLLQPERCDIVSVQIRPLLQVI